LVLGIDPGSNATGLAALRRERGRYVLEWAGVVRTRSEDPMPERLLAIHMGVGEALGRLRPQAVAIEAIFKHRSAESALRLGHARGVALLACAEAGLAVAEYNPMVIKQSIGGHGRAGKDEIKRLIARLLGLEQGLPSDASDAAAIAMTHLARATFEARLLMARGGEE
jgi:crossover junction endodeoxyribonuclease RuvC